MNGVVAAGDPQTAQAGVDILAQGGNAVDAAVAAAFVSFLSEVAMVNLGGSGLAHIFDPQTGQSHVYDFFSTMPGLGREIPLAPSQLDFQKVTVDFGATTQDFYVGRGSVAVPGNVFGLCQMVVEHGRLPLAEVLAPAIKLAEEGLHLTEYQAVTLKLLYPIFMNTAVMRDVFGRGDDLLSHEDRLHIPDLADTLRLIASQGADTLRAGRLAEAIVADQEAHGGLLTAVDLASYQVLQQDPIHLPYRGYDIYLPRPCSIGGVLTAFTLKLLSQFNVRAYGHQTADYLQLFTEAMSATTRARRHWDMAHRYLTMPEAVAAFLQDEFVNDFAAETAAALWKGRPSQMFSERESHPDTSHISVIDGAGMAVGLTTSAGESAGYIVPGTGFIPNNMLGEEDLHPQGFHQMPAGQRINTMMAPVIVLKDGKIKLVVGSGGSIRIRSAILQVLSNVLDFDMPLAEAVAAPRIHLENKVLQCEAGVKLTAVDELESLGYWVNRWPSRSLYFGGAHSVGVNEAGEVIGVGDDRRSGSVRTVNSAER